MRFTIQIKTAENWNHDWESIRMIVLPSRDDASSVAQILSNSSSIYEVRIAPTGTSSGTYTRGLYKPQRKSL